MSFYKRALHSRRKTEQLDAATGTATKQKKFMKLFQKKGEKKTIKCSHCFATHPDIETNKYCCNCGHCLWIQTAHQTTVDDETDKALKKQLVSFTSQRYHLVSEYHNQCKAVDKMIIQFIQHKINIEQQYIDSNRVLIAKCNEQNQVHDDEFTSTLKQIMITYTETIEETITEHQTYLSFLKETDQYLQTENETMLDFINEFKQEHDEKLQKVWLQWRDIEYLWDSQKIEEIEYNNKKNDLWDEWQSFLKVSLQSFPIFMKTRYKKIVYKVLSNTILNQMTIHNKAHGKCLNLWRIIHEITNQHTEMHTFIQYHEDCDVDSLESLIHSLGLETKTGDNGKGIDAEDGDKTNMSRHYGEILRRTRGNGIEWFPPLIFSEKGKKKWNLDDNEWNVIIFEQLLCEAFITNRRWDKKEQLMNYAPINCVRGQLEISKKKMNHLVDLLMIDDTKYKEIRKYKLTSLCHRIEVVEHLDLNEDFNGNVDEYISFVHRQLSFILSCLVWYIVESQRTFWNVSGSKHNKSDLVQSLHTNMALVQDFCRENQANMIAFSPVNHLMLMMQEIAEGINDENITISHHVAVPNVIYQKMYRHIIMHCLVDSPNDILEDILDDDEHKDQRLELYDEWTQIADLLFDLSKQHFKISVHFHCFAFLELIFDRILDTDNLRSLKPESNTKDRVLLKIMEETFLILMDDDDRSEMNKYQEDMYMEKVMDKIENKLVLWCSDYRYCTAHTVSKFFLFFILMKKMKKKDSHDKLIEFTLITATQLSHELKLKYCGQEDDEELQLKLEKIHNLKSFRVDFLRILHDEMKWHSNLDEYLTQWIGEINTVILRQITDFDNNHAETFLLQWMSRFSDLVNDKLQHLKHQDIDQDFLHLIHEINQFILITNQYRNRVSIKNKQAWYSAMPPLNKICVFKFKQWVKTEIDPIFIRCIDTMIKNEDWKTRKSRKRRSSSLKLYRISRHSLMSDAINDALTRKSESLEAEERANTDYISDEVIDLCALIDSMTNGCLSFHISLKLYNFADSKSYWKVLQKQLNRVCEWVCTDIDEKISKLIPPIPVLSRNIINMTSFQRKAKPIVKAHGVLRHLGLKKDSDDSNSDEAVFSAKDALRTQKRLQDKEQGIKLKKLAVQMHSLDFILSSLDKTKRYISEQYTKFIQNEFKEDAAQQYLQREVEFTLHNENVSEFLFYNFEFIALTYDEYGAAKDGLIVSSVKKQSIEHKYDVSIGYQLIQIGDKKCKNEGFEDIMERIQTDYDEVSEKVKLRFQFNVKGAIHTLFHGIYSNYNASLKLIASLISCEIMYTNLSDDLFGKLYHVPLDENRFSDLNITNKLFGICDPIFEFLNDKNFTFIIADIFNHLMDCVSYVLTQTKNISTKPWIRNDYGLIRDDIHSMILSFEDDIDETHMEHRCIRIDAILEMLKFSTTHLTQHTLPTLQNFNAYCANNHVLFECMVEPNKMLNYDRDDSSDDPPPAGIELIRCAHCRLLINIKYKLNDIGYYFCGHDMCLKQNVFYCGKCCNQFMFEQNAKSNISKWDLVSMLNKKKDNQSKQFAIKFAQNQCIRSQITMTLQHKEWMLLQQKKKKQKKNRKKSGKKKKKHSKDTDDLVLSK
eukprot:232009_1